MAARMTSARFVGRTAQLAELEAALRDAAGSRPSLALIAGESGVGKSRLADELVGQAKELGAVVLHGECVELGEGELPYAPLLGALRPLVRERHPALDSLPPALRAGLDSLLPALGSASGPEPVAQSQVFEALLALLEALGEEEPVLLVIEDLHWADSSTRSFLSFLARTLCGESLLVVGTYRSDELHRRHPLRPLLAELGRDQVARLIELPSFTREEMAAQLEGILAAPPDPGLVDRLYPRSEGNALFTEEILAAGLDGRGALPPTLRDALMLRVERLSRPAQELLRWLACQPAADHELLTAVAGVSRLDLREALREAVASQIAVTLPDGSYAFRHALLREVVHDDLLPGERTEMHAALARTLEARIDSGERGAHITAEAAHHWRAAGDQPAALAASVRAARAAEWLNASAEAQSLFERALELWDRVPDPEALAGATRVELLERAADAADAASDPVRQEALLRRALALVDEAEEPRRAAGLLRSLGFALWNLHHQDEAIATFDRALALLPEGEQSSDRAALLGAKAKKRMLQARFAEAEEAASEALSVARAVGDVQTESRALNALGVAKGGQGDWELGTEHLREALALAQPLSVEEGSAWLNLSDLLNLSGNTREALTVAREALAQGSKTPSRHEDWFQLAVAEFSFHLGDWTEAGVRIPPASRRHMGPTLANWYAVRSMLALGRGDLEAAAKEIDGLTRATRGSTEPQFVAPRGIFAAELARRGGDLDAARIAIDDSLDQIEFCSDDFMRITALSTAGLRVEGDAGQLASDRRDSDAEARVRRRPGKLIERVRLAAGLGGPVEQAEQATAEAEYARATGADDASLWVASAEAWDALSRPYPATYARWRQAEAMAGEREREGAAEVAAGALEAARALGSDWLAAELESLGTRARLRIGEENGDEPADAGPGVEPDPFGLTERERQVLELVAEGATNRVIGERLHMAEKTASVHVSRILAKLDVRSRTEAAAVAHRHGMTPAA